MTHPIEPVMCAPCNQGESVSGDNPIRVEARATIASESTLVACPKCKRADDVYYHGRVPINEYGCQWCRITFSAPDLPDAKVPS
jgi:hypothetical protein